MDTEEAYIESRLPLEQISIECAREGSAAQHPPPNRLHVWWARRPLTASRAAVLGSLLPSTVSDREFLELLGIKGDPVAAQKKIQEATRTGIRVPDPFGYARAFTHNLEESQLRKLRALYEERFGSASPLVLDPMAGGGSIPFEALRAGARVIVGELNPVAQVILKATLGYPARFGLSLLEDIAKWGQWVNSQARKDLEEFYPHGNGEHVLAYLWSRTVRCPSCNLVLPLSRNWWLSRRKGKKEKVAVRPDVPATEVGDEVDFEIVDPDKYRSFDPSKGTVGDGRSQCLRCKNPILDDYIKAEAQQGRMGHKLYAVFIERKTGPRHSKKGFRLPGAEDLNAYEKARNLVDRGAFRGVTQVPKEPFPQGSDNRPLYYGMSTWDKFFNPRQLVTHASYMSRVLEAKKRIFESLQGGPERATAIVTYLALMLDKSLDYDSVLCPWHPTREVIAHTFDRHDYSFIWSYGEMNLIVDDLGFEWAMGQVLDAYKGLCKLLNGVDASFTKFDLGSSTDLSYVRGLVDAVIVDPPYYANVMYAELSDFFYVWMKRVLSDLHPGFDMPLTDKDSEVVANRSRFRDLGVSAEGKAREDYQLKMSQTFKQVYRVLKPNGILVVMFTHKATEAWDSLASALIEAGFQIKRSWPVRTESESSLHIAKKNAVKSTILLVARKTGDRARGWWEHEVYPEIERMAETRAAEFEARGVEGVDLYISTFGPVLEVFSRYREVKFVTGERVLPEEALEVARKIVTNRTFLKLVPGGAPGMDESTKFYILAMYFYHARQFPFDEAHKLAISVGTDSNALRDQAHIINKKQEDVIVLDAAERERSGDIELENPSDKPLINAIHSAELAFQRGGLKAYRALAAKLNLDTNPDFQDALKALRVALPDTDPEKDAMTSLTNATASRAKGSRMEDYLDR